MSGKTYDLHGIRVFECDDEEPVLRNDQDGVAIIAEAMSQGAKLVVIPVKRIDPGFFHLRTGIAGAIVQKFVNYQMKLAVIGDLSAMAATSSALQAFISESNRGEQIWFLASGSDLEKRRRREK